MATFSLITKNRTVEDPQGSAGSLIEFNKVSCEICEIVPAGTSINYYVAVGTEEIVVNSGTPWMPIDPLNRTEPTQPTLLELGELDDITFTDIELSYDAFSTTDVSPGYPFELITGASSTTTATPGSGGPRYSFYNPEDRILDHQMATDVEINEDNLVLFRNVGIQGNTTKVRGVQRGWGYTEPYYSTVVRITNANGLDVDFGDKAVIIDDEITSGKVTIATGIHRVSVHRDNFLTITASLDDLVSLINADILYPYNHKLLIEGYLYGDSYTAGSEQVYGGVDLFAEKQMKKVGVFDLINNVAKDDFDRFAIDKDTGSSVVTRTASRIFLLKVDNLNADFVNELFQLEFDILESTFTYLRFRADLITSDSTLTPSLGNIRIKFG